MEPGDGWFRCKAGREGEWWKVWSFNMIPSNMCCGAIFGSWDVPGVSAREMGECDRSDAPEEALCEDLGCE